jgi:hypothetical protein
MSRINIIVQRYTSFTKKNLGNTSDYWVPEGRDGVIL